MRPRIDDYSTRLVAVSATSVGETRLNTGGRVLLPPTCLQEISHLSMVYPLQFRITAINQRRTYAAVLEFNAEMGTIVLPDWMYDQLQLRGGAPVKVETCCLEAGRLVKLQPHNKAFVMLQDPRLLLEQHLTNYPILSQGSIIVIHHAKRDFRIDVVEILDAHDRPAEAVLTARADAQATELKVEFERPLDMPPSPTNTAVTPTSAASPSGSNVIGSPSGHGVQFSTLIYKPPTLTTPTTSAPEGVPPTQLQGDAGTAESGADNGSAATSFVPFAGAGRRLSEHPPVQAVEAGKAQSLEALQRELREKRLKAFGGKGQSS